MNKKITGLNQADSIAISGHDQLRFVPFFMMLLAACWLLAGVAHAQAPTAHAQAPATDDAQQLRALYSELLLNPTDVTKTLEYSALASKMGDYESAIPPLERLLLVYPNATQLKLQLGGLYRLLGAKDAAESYLVDVSTDANASAEERAEAENQLKQL